MKHFVPISPDPYLKKRKGDGALARFGHLNVLVDKINEIDASQSIIVSGSNLILGLNVVNLGTVGSVNLPCLSVLCACTGGCGPVGAVIIKNADPVNALTIIPCAGESINGGAPGAPIVLAPGNSIQIADTSCETWESYADAAGSPGVPGPPPCVEPSLVQAPTVLGEEVIKGTGALGNCLSVCIDGTTITQNAEGCLQVANPFVPSGSACPYQSNPDYAEPLGRADTFAMLSGAAMTIGLAAQNVTGDIGYLGATPAALIGTPSIINGNGYGSTSAQTGQANYYAGAQTDATALYGILSILVGGAMPAPLTGGGSGIITPGTYGTIAGVAMTTAADTEITLDGAGCYVFIGPSLATLANNTITLINGAKASDVYFVTSGTSDLAADNIWKGTLLSVGAVGTGAHTTLEGRAISTTGAVTIGAGNANGIGAYFVPLS